MRAGLLHFGASVLVAALVAALIFGIWFPYPYREMAGGSALFWLIVSVDVVSGPLLTMVLSSPTKPRKELWTDILLVVVLQLGALVYGLYTLSLARPVAVVFEVDRFRMVTTADLLEIVDGKAQEPTTALSWTGPELKGIRPIQQGDDSLTLAELGLQGIEPSMMPSWWADYAPQVPKVMEKAQPMAQLKSKHPSKVALIDEVLLRIGQPQNKIRWIPLVSRRSMEWVMLLDGKGQPVGYLPLDGF